MSEIWTLVLVLDVWNPNCLKTRIAQVWISDTYCLNEVLSSPTNICTYRRLVALDSGIIFCDLSFFNYTWWNSNFVSRLKPFTVERQNPNFFVFGFQTEQNRTFGSRNVGFGLFCIEPNIKHSVWTISLDFRQSKTSEIWTI